MTTCKIQILVTLPYFHKIVREPINFSYYFSMVASDTLLLKRALESSFDKLIKIALENV